jgi:hypothetical protein
MTSSSNIARDLEFPDFEQVASLLSVSHLFPKSKKRCGIYILSFPNNLFYIGQAVDAVRRFSQHRNKYDDIQAFSFLPIPKGSLDGTERELIFRAESLGYHLKNAVFVSSIVGEADFDLVVSQNEQEYFVSKNCDEIDTSILTPIIILPDSQISRFSKNIDKFSSHQLSKQGAHLLSTYIRKCIPFPRKTEYSFWSVSCLPSTNISTWPRLFAVNAASMELFVFGWEAKTKLAYGFITVADDILEEYWPDAEIFKKHYPFVEIISRGYRDAGQYQITLHVSGGAPIDALLKDEGVCKAASVLALRVMRKRANFYSQYHCAQLVNHVLSAPP